MDIAYFNRSKTRFACWLGLPPLLIGLAMGSSALYTYRTNKVFNDRMAYLQIIPTMESKLDAAKDTLGSFFDDQSSIDSLNTALNRYASQSNLLVNSLTASEFKRRGAKPKDSKTETTEFKMTARGSMVALMKFCHAVQNEQPVLTLYKTTVTFTQMDPNPQYQVEMIFHHHKVKM